MSKTKGSKNFYQGSEYYKLNSLLAYFQQKYPEIKYPQSWETGGGLNDLVRKLGYVPEIDNGIPGRGHMTKFKGTTMQKIAKSVRNYLKDTTPKKPRLTPIEVANKEAKKQEEQTPVIVLDPTPEQVEEFKEKWLECNEPVELKPLDLVPKGFIEVNGKKGERILFRAADVFEVCDWVEGDVDGLPTHLVILRENTQMALMISNSYDEVIEKLRKAMEV